MKRLLCLLTMSLALTFAACAADPGKLTSESREALKRLRAEKIMCPINLYTNCTLEADFSVETNSDSLSLTFAGQMVTSNRSFNNAHRYISRMFDEPVTLTTACDTTGYGARLDRWVRFPLDTDSFLAPFSPRKSGYTNIDAQLEYLGTENGISNYRLYYLVGQMPVECRYWCDTDTRCITQATIAFITPDHVRIEGEVLLNPYSGISRTSYPQDACYLKFAREIRYRLTQPDSTTLSIRLSNIRLTDIGTYKTGHRKE